MSTETSATPASAMRAPVGTGLPVMDSSIASEIEALIAKSSVAPRFMKKDKIEKNQPGFGHCELSRSKHVGLPDPVVREVTPANGDDLRRVPVVNVPWVPLQDPRPVESEEVTLKLAPLASVDNLPGLLRFEALTRSAEAAARAEGTFHGTLASLLGPTVVNNNAASGYALAVRAFMAVDALAAGGVADGRPRAPVHVFRAPTAEWAHVAEQYRGAVRVPVLASDSSDYVSTLLTLMLPGGIGALAWEIPGHPAMPAGARIMMPGGAARFLLLEEARAEPLAVVVGGAALTLPRLEAFIERLTRVLGSNTMAHAAKTAAHLGRVYRPPGGAAPVDPLVVNFVPRVSPPISGTGEAMALEVRPVLDAEPLVVDPGRFGYGAAYVGRHARSIGDVCGEVASHLDADHRDAIGPAGRRDGDVLRCGVRLDPDEPHVNVAIGVGYVRVGEEDVWMQLPRDLQRDIRELRIREGLMPGGHDPRPGPAPAGRFTGMRNVFGQVDQLSTLVAPSLEFDGLAALLVRLCVPTSSLGDPRRRLSCDQWVRIMSVEACRMHLFTMRALYLSGLVPPEQHGVPGRELRAVLPSKVLGAAVPVSFDMRSMPFGSLECLEDGSWFRDPDPSAAFSHYSVGGTWESGSEAGAAWPSDGDDSALAIDAALRLAHALGEDVALGRPTQHAVVVPCSRAGVACPFGFPLKVPVGTGVLRGEVVFGDTGSLLFANGVMPKFKERHVVAPY